MNDARTVLVIDDEESICYAFRRFFETRQWRVLTAASGGEGVALAREHRPTVTFLDVRLPDRSGLELLEDLAAIDTPVVVITAFSSLETVVRAMQNRVLDYLVKPVDLDKALDLATLASQRCEAAPANAPAAASPAEGTLVGDSPPMQQVYKLIARASGSSAAVLITGATGTGKELTARAIHQFSARSSKPLVAINCGALPENLVESELFGSVRGAFTGAEGDRPGRFELADGGTLLLDEIGELSPSAQVKLLRVLDSGLIDRIGATRSTRVDVRMLAATNRDLEHEVQQGRFRADLYYRLAVFHIHLPPLCERRADIPAIVRALLGQSSQPGASVSDEAMQLLIDHDWPGNVRELKNMLEHGLAVAPGRIILPEHLPDSLHRGPAPTASGDRVRESILAFLTREPGDAMDRYGRTIAHVERTMLEYALQRFHGKQTEAAAYLGLHRNTLRNKIREYQLVVGD